MFNTAATSDFLIWGAIALVVIIILTIIIAIVAKKRKGNDESFNKSERSSGKGKHVK